jgi:hypothetical protein
VRQLGWSSKQRRGWCRSWCRRGFFGWRVRAIPDRNPIRQHRVPAGKHGNPTGKYGDDPTGKYGDPTGKNSDSFR